MTAGSAGWTQATIELARRLPVELDSVTLLAERIGQVLGVQYRPAAPVGWIIIDGPSAAGKDTQIGLLANALTQCGSRTAVVTGRGGGTALGALEEDLTRCNQQGNPPTRWRADLLVKTAAWTVLRQGGLHTPADIVISNRGPVSQLAYSAVSLGDPEIRDGFGLALLAAQPPGDTSIILMAPEATLEARAQARSHRTGKAAREVDSPSFIRQVAAAFGELARLHASAMVIDASPATEVVHLRLLAVVLDRLAVLDRAPGARSAALHCAGSGPCT